MSFFEELKRRNVVKVGIAYLVAAWLLLQLTEVLTELLELDTQIGKMVILLLIIGFIPALIFAWAFEMTPEGIKRDKDVDRSQSVAKQTGQKLNIAVIVMLAMIAGYFIWESRFKAQDTAPQETAVIEVLDEVTPEPGETFINETTIDTNAIAVLPFANRSNVDEDLFFTDGIHDDLLTQLAKIGDLKVISRTSVMEYRDTTKKIAEIAAELGVGKILEGGVQRAGDRIRINAQLIDVATDQHLWAETFNREMTIDNIFDIQSEITTQIVTAVKGELSDVERARLSDRPTDNLAAWEAYLHARAIINEPDYGAEKYQRAEPFALEALEQDPNFAEAWAILANIQMQGIWIGYANTEEQRTAVRDSLARAEALDPDNPEVRANRADYYYRVEVDYAAALALLDEAVKQTPGYSKLHRDRGLSLRRLGRWEESVQAFEKSVEVDPLNSFAASTLVETLMIMNALDRAESLVDSWLRKQPDSTDFLNYKARIMLRRRGEVEQAWQLLESNKDVSGSRHLLTKIDLAAMRGDWDTAIELAVDESAEGFLPITERVPAWRAGWVYAMKGNVETARDYFTDYISFTQENERTGRLAQGLRHTNLAEAYAWLGENDLARRHSQLAAQFIPLELDHVFGTLVDNRLTWVFAKTGDRELALERIAAKLDKPVGFSRWELHLDPRWDFFRDDARFNALALPEGVEPEPFRAQRLGDGT